MYTKNILICSILCLMSCHSSTITEDGNNKLDSNMVLYHNMLGVKTCMGADSCWLLFDTGALGKCDLDDDVIIKHLGVDSITERNYRWPDTIKIAGIPTGHEVVGSTLKFPFIARSETPKKILPIDFFKGIIGPRFGMDNRIWEINFERRQMTIHEKDTIPPFEKSYAITIRKGIPYVHIPMQFILGKDTLLVKEEYVLDLGADSFIVYDRITSDLLARFSRLPHIDLRYSNPRPIRVCKADRVLFPDGLPVIPDAILTVLDTHGSGFPTAQRLGLQFWQRFNIMIDCGRKLLYLSPYPYDSSLVKSSASNYTRSKNNLGFFVLKDGTVTCLFDGMTAQRAGLRIGDRIATLNEYDFTELSTNEQDSIFNAMPAGCAVRLNIIRDHKSSDIEFTTHRNPLR